MKSLIAIAVLVCLSNVARADCECTCVGGEYQAVCDDSAEDKPECPTEICAIAPPVADEAAEEPYLPPARRRACRPEMAWDPVLREYRRMVVCD